MGNASRRSALFMAKHPMCCYCGGNTPTATEDHWPSRAIFDERQWPEGYVFPACVQCNAATADDETLFAMLCRINQDSITSKAKERTQKLIMAVKERYPEIYRSLRASSTDIKRYLRESDQELPTGKTTKDLPLLSLKHPEVHAVVLRCAAKLYLSLHYMHTGQPLPTSAGILFRWFTNATPIDNIPVLEILPEITGFPELKRQQTSLHNQFNYRFGVMEDKSASVFFVTFNNAMGMVGVAYRDIADAGDLPNDAIILRPFSSVGCGEARTASFACDAA